MSTPTPASSSPQELQQQLTETSQKKRFYETYFQQIIGVIGLVVSIGVVVLTFALNRIAKQLDTIEKHSTALAKLEDLPQEMTDFRGEIRKLSNETNAQVVETTRRLATIEALPDRITALATNVAAANTAASQTTQEIKQVASAQAVAAKEIESVRTSLTKQQEQLDQLRDEIKETRSAVAAVGALKPHGRTSAVALVQLREGKPLPEAGKFMRYQIDVPFEDVPLLADAGRSPGVSVTSAELVSEKEPEAKNRVTIQAQVNHAESKLLLVLWHAKTDKLPVALAECYARVSLSWPDAP
jgi:predicted RNase H-like nuclease (RuvC/YqgF family)